MPSSRPELEGARALDRKLTLLDRLAETYAHVISSILESDLEEAGRRVEEAEPILEDLRRNDRVLVTTGTSNHDDVESRMKDVRDLHAKLAKTVSEEQEGVLVAQGQIRDTRRALRGYRRVREAGTGTRLDGEV